MAHDLEIRDGKASMMYVGEEPWHGLGTRLDRPATAAEAIKAARLDWEVAKYPLYARSGLRSKRVPNLYAVVRKDRWQPGGDAVLGVVGRDYTPLQNRDAFAFFDPIVGKGAAIYHTAGVLGRGERVWMLAKLPDNIRVVGEDVVDKYLLLCNSHDGTSAVQVKFTPVRVVCRNTLSLALKKGETVRVVHTRDVKERLKQAHRLLGIVTQRYEELADYYSQMARVSMANGRLDEYLRMVFPDPPESDNYEARMRAVLRDRALSKRFFAEGKGNGEKGIAGTLWAAYNGVVEYVDHWIGPRQSADSRLRSVWFGRGCRTKARAFEVARSKMQAWLN